MAGAPPDGLVILHIGLEKTGTTAIQVFLADNAAMIHEAGTTVSNLPRRSGISLIAACVVDPAKREDIHALFQVQEGNQTAVRSLVRRQLAIELAAGLPVLVSSEHLSSRVVRTDELRLLAALLEPIASEVRILLYLRRQEELIPSTYSTSVLAGGVRGFSLEAAMQERNRYDYAALLDRWREAFPDRLSVQVFREEWKDSPGELPRHFCQSAGIPWNEAFAVRAGRISGSMSAQALGIGRWLNRLAADGLLTRPIWRDVMLRLQHLDRRHPFALDDDERLLVWSHFQATNERAAAELSPEDATYLLAPPTPTGPSSAHEESDDEVRELIADILAWTPDLDVECAVFLRE